MKKIMTKYAFIWPLLGSVLLWIAISIVSGKFSVGQIFSSAKLCSFALLLALGQMVVVTSGEGAIDLSQQYILTLAAYISCDLMQYNVILGIAAAVAVGGSLWSGEWCCQYISESAGNGDNVGNGIYYFYNCACIGTLDENSSGCRICGFYQSSCRWILHVDSYLHSSCSVACSAFV